MLSSFVGPDQRSRQIVFLTRRDFQKWTLVEHNLALLFWVKLHAWPPPLSDQLQQRGGGGGGATAVSAAPEPVALTRPGPPPNRPYRPFSL